MFKRLPPSPFAPAEAGLGGLGRGLVRGVSRAACLRPPSRSLAASWSAARGSLSGAAGAGGVEAVAEAGSCPAREVTGASPPLAPGSVGRLFPDPRHAAPSGCRDLSSAALSPASLLSVSQERPGRPGRRCGLFWSPWSSGGTTVGGGRPADPRAKAGEGRAGRWGGSRARGSPEGPGRRG